MDVKQVAALAKLRFAETEEAALAEEFAAILRFAQAMDGLDTQDVPATVLVEHAVALREDAVMPSMPRDTLLVNAPEQRAGYISVPKAME